MDTGGSREFCGLYVTAEWWKAGVALVVALGLHPA